MRYLYSPDEYYSHRAPKTLELIDKKDGKNFVANCPFCEGKEKFWVQKALGLYICFKCNAKGTMVKYEAHFGNVSEEEAYQRLAASGDVPVRRDTAIIENELVNEFHKHLLESPIALKFISEKWKFSPEAIERFNLGLKDGALTFPIYNNLGECVNIRFKPLWRKPGDPRPKMWNYTNKKDDAKYSQPRLYPQNLVVAEQELFLFAGEKDLISSWSMGIKNGITTTHGEGTFPPNFAFDLAGKTIHIVYDNDKTGIFDAKKVYEELKYVAKVDIVVLPIMEPYVDGTSRKDITDFWLLGNDLEAFQKLIAGQVIEMPVGTAETARPSSVQRSLPVLKSLLTKEETEFLNEQVPNLVDMYVDYASDVTNSPVSYHRLSGLWLASNLLGRNCVNIYGIDELYANIFVMIIGTSTRLYKTSCTKNALKILLKVDPDAMALTTFTPVGLMTKLSTREDKVTSAVYFDEIAILFDAIKQLDFMSGTRENMVKLFDNQPIVYTRSKDELEIKKSYLTLIGSGIPSTVASLLTWKDIETRFIPQFLVDIESQHNEWRPVMSEETYNQTLMREEVTEEAIRIRNMWQKPWKLLLNKETKEFLRPDPERPETFQYRFLFDQNALQRFYEFEKEVQYGDETNATTTLSFAHMRLPMLARKLATIYAAIDPNIVPFGNTVAINMEHILLAIRDLDRYRIHMVELLSAVGLTDIEKSINEVIELVYRNPRITRTEIARQIKMGTKKDLDIIIATCLDRGVIRASRLQGDNFEYIISN